MILKTPNETFLKITRYYLWESFQDIWSMSKCTKSNIKMAVSLSLTHSLSRAYFYDPISYTLMPSLSPALLFKPSSDPYLHNPLPFLAEDLLFFPSLLLVGHSPPSSSFIPPCPSSFTPSVLPQFNWSSLTEVSRPFPSHISFIPKASQVRFICFFEPVITSAEKNRGIPKPPLSSHWPTNMKA